MHACGHDAHTALGLAVARWIMENRKRLTGVIKLIFQPAEEGVRGANAIVGSGFVDDVDVILASHCGGAIKSKQIGLVYDGLLASTKFDIRFTGVPSHAGNQPHAAKARFCRLQHLSANGRHSATRRRCNTCVSWQTQRRRRPQYHTGPRLHPSRSARSDAGDQRLSLPQC